MGIQLLLQIILHVLLQPGAGLLQGELLQQQQVQGPHVITYNTVGTYNASLTVTKAASTDTETKTGYINVINAVFNMTNGTITTCSGNFYDSGGSSGSYATMKILPKLFILQHPGQKSGLLLVHLVQNQVMTI